MAFGALPVLAAGAMAQGNRPAAVAERDNRDKLSLREPLILDLRLGKLRLAEAFPAMLSGSSLELPLGDLAQVLDLAITVNDQAGIAGGWFLSEDRLFSLSIARGEVIIAGRKQTFDAALVHVADGDIYVDVRLLSRWLPIDIAFDLANLTATLTSREPLPIEARLAREEARDRAMRQRRPDIDYPKIVEPPAAISWPRADLYMEGTRNTGQGDKVDGAYNLTAAGEVLGTSASMFVAGARGQAISDIRTSFERTDVDGGLMKDTLGDLGATQIRGGDIYTPQHALVSRTQVAAGASVTNFAVGGTPDEFDRITLTGDLPLGWELEVYRNETLIDFATARSDGRYEFRDVPLLFGVNVIRLVFFGPQGQTREETRQVRVGLDQIKPGEVKYELAAGLHDGRILGQQKISSRDVRRDQARVLARVQTGISDSLSAGVNMVSLPRDGGDRDVYVGSTVAASFGNLFGKVDLVDQQDGGWATRVVAQTSILGVSTIAEHNVMRNFFSEQFTGTGTSKLNSRSRLRFDGNISVFDLPQMPVSLTIDHDRFVNGDRTSTLSGRMTVPIGRVSLTHTLNYSRSKTASGTEDTMSGTFLVGGRVNSTRLRGTVGYTAAPEADIGAITLTAEQRISRNLEVSLGLERSAPPSPVNTVTFGLSTLTDWSAWGLDLEYSDDATFLARVNLAMSLGVNPTTMRPQVTADRMATQGAILARVFLDRNGNGRFDGDDAPLEGVRLEIDRGMQREKSDKDGYIYLAAVTPNRRQVVSVEQESLEDPFLVSLKPGLSVAPNPGGTVRLDFPVVTTGEIDGTVFKVEGSEVFPVSGAEVQLLDGDGKVVRDLRSAYDGFFLMQFVPPGDYTLRLNPEQMKELGLVPDHQVPVTIEGDGTVVSNQDFTVRPVNGAAGKGGGRQGSVAKPRPRTAAPATAPAAAAEPAAPAPAPAPPPAAQPAPAQDGEVPPAVPVTPVTPAPLAPN